MQENIFRPCTNPTLISALLSKILANLFQHSQFLQSLEFPRTCSKITSYAMADLKFYNYPGVGEQNKTDAWYSQAVRIGDRIECSGQGKLSSRAPFSRYPIPSIPCSFLLT